MSEYTPGLIRDARGLTPSEALFLFVVDSRGQGGMYCTADTAAADMKMSIRTYKTVRKSVVDKGLVLATERPSRTTLYRINVDALKALTSADVAPVVTSADPALVTPTSADLALVTSANVAPAASADLAPVTSADLAPRRGTDKVNQKENNHSNTYSSVVGGGRFRRGVPPREDKRVRTKTASSGQGRDYAYNNFAEQCAICRVWLQPGQGTLLRNQRTQKLHAAHHVDECPTHHLTQDERGDHLAGLVPLTTPLAAINFERLPS